MTEKPERPASLQRRRPRPAPDEHIDPVNYTPPAPATTPQPVTPVVSSPPVQAAPAAQPPVAPKRGRGRPRREPTIQLGVRVAQDVSDLIEEPACTLYGTEAPVVFNSSAPASPRLGRTWSALARYGVDVVRSDAFLEPLARAQLARHLMVGMLERFQLIGDRQQRYLSVEAQACRYRVAVQFFDDFASLPITVEKRMPPELLRPPLKCWGGHSAPT